MVRQHEKTAPVSKGKAGMAGQDGNGLLKFRRAYFTKENMAYWVKDRLPELASAALVQPCRGGWVLSYVM